MSILGLSNQISREGAIYGMATGLGIACVCYPLLKFMIDIMPNNKTGEEKKSELRWTFTFSILTLGLLGACIGGFAPYALETTHKVAMNYFKK